MPANAAEDMLAALELALDTATRLEYADQAKALSQLMTQLVAGEVADPHVLARHCPATINFLYSHGCITMSQSIRHAVVQGEITVLSTLLAVCSDEDKDAALDYIAVSGGDLCPDYHKRCQALAFFLRYPGVSASAKVAACHHVVKYLGSLWILTGLLCLPDTIITQECKEALLCGETHFAAREVLMQHTTPTIHLLHRAVTRGSAHTAEFVLSCVAVPEAIKVEEYHRACEYGHYRIASLLVPDEHLDDTDGNGNTLLHLLVTAQELVSVIRLIERGADYTLLDHQGKSFLGQVFSDNGTVFIRKLHNLYRSAPWISTLLYPGIPGLVPDYLIGLVLEFLYGTKLGRDLHEQSHGYHETKARRAQQQTMVVTRTRSRSHQVNLYCS